MRERMTPDRAETIALNGLAFLASRQDHFDRFVLGAGLEPSALRAQASDAGFLQAVVDFLLKDDILLMDFCREQELEARDIHLTHHVLGGP
ncbi:MAG: DUF3572 domain-containing protein [Alphaproteobacteria bacterium]|nr:DUF3572 domain-containing protein [Alphaproteobacteria bacterium]MDE1985330.1 DUF3572 domain-containing protein [Alphaproteobacteria bacterium]MDE2162043.1 DUF3572 domain-containing protein [Alphaproteobacteria bacterium]MDE2265383.1 DUF3572 domain-containing protein [Alphaproteobacteria bacterium]MDE2500659.1 DUF3572 domain-containing protein [Alphaproteobacteria bacterium]